MLHDKYDRQKLKEILLPANEWKPFPLASDRKSWESHLSKPINQFRKTEILSKAEEHLQKDWAVLPANLFMEFQQNGNRSNFETPYFKRRTRFSELILAECIEAKGRFIPDIINGFSAILEETSWCLPAHVWNSPEDPLPNPYESIPDLFACQTAMVLAESYYLLKDQLFNISPNLCLRIKIEIKKRALKPYMMSHKCGWDNGHNNWSIWCASNLLGSAMYTLDDPDELSETVNKLLLSFDHYFNKYPEDGACDEGPNYWDVSPGIMTMFLELLKSRSNGKIDIYDNPKIKRMAKFIDDAHISKKYFINFADAGTKASPQKGLTYKLGQRTKQECLQHLVQLNAMNWNYEKTQSDIPLNGSIINLMLRDLFWFEPLEKPIAFTKEIKTWYPETEILICRESKEPDKGMYCAIKGGNNGENHNHNDVGHFILFSDGRPCIIDVGVETYTKETFSPNRYKLPFMKSSGHDIPTINGYEQLPGKEHKASDTKCMTQANQTFLEMNLENLYSKKSHLVFYKRRMDFDHQNGTVNISDEFIFDREKNEIEINFYCQEKPENTNDGRIKLLSSPDVYLKTTDNNMQFTFIPIEITDKRLANNWNSPIYKITGKSKIEKNQKKITYQFS